MRRWVFLLMPNLAPNEMFVFLITGSRLHANSKSPMPLVMSLRLLVLLLLLLLLSDRMTPTL